MHGEDIARQIYVLAQTVKHSEVKINATTRRSWHHSDSLSTVQILVLTDETKNPVNPVRYILVKIIVAIQLSCGDNILIVKKT